MKDILERIKQKDPEQKEFHQAVGEVFESVKPVLDRNPQYRKADSGKNRRTRTGDHVSGSLV